MRIVTKNFPYQTTKFRISIPIQARTETFCFENSRLFSSVNNSKVVFRFLGHRSLPKILIDRQFESCSWAWNSLMVLSNWPRACWLVLGNSKSGHNERLITDLYQAGNEFWLSTWSTNKHLSAIQQNKMNSFSELQKIALLLERYGKLFRLLHSHLPRQLHHTKLTEVNRTRLPTNPITSASFSTKALCEQNRSTAGTALELHFGAQMKWTKISAVFFLDWF